MPIPYPPDPQAMIGRAKLTPEQADQLLAGSNAVRQGRKAFSSTGNDSAVCAESLGNFKP
jgi:hypothetical protein